MLHATDNKILAIRLPMLAALFALTLSLVSCSKSETVAPAKEAQVGQTTFATPDAAGAAFVGAAKSDDQAALLAMFDPGARDVLLSGDPVKDKDDLKDFVAAYNQMHRWREIKVGGEILYTGADNFAFPIPLAQNPAGKWYFDTPAGKDEILARRIGKDELTAIAACGGIFDAQKQYFAQMHDGARVKQYAQKFVSDPGQQNGLYWDVSEGQTPSPLQEARDFAKAAGYTNAGNSPQPYNGYFFRILTKQGDKAKGGVKDYLVDGKMTAGFAVVAYPAEYRNSGIMTFIVGTDGVILQKDQGEKTTDLGAAMTEYNPGDDWKPAL
jgi:hypothetical protein